MVKKRVEYECEICRSAFKNKKDADECEAKGVPKLYPIGMIFSYGDDEMVFVIIKQHPKNYSHHHSYSTWACRDNGAGDNAKGKDFCGLESWDRIFPPNKKLPAYERMIKALKANKTKPIDYIEESNE